jgi:hypothetical protein
LPPAGELLHRAEEVVPFDFKLPGDFSALPVGLAGIAHQEIMSRFPGQERIVLPEITDSQLRMTDYFSAVEFFFPQQNAEQSRFPGPVATDKPDFHIFDERDICIIKEQLIAVTFFGVAELQEDSHWSADGGSGV